MVNPIKAVKGSMLLQDLVADIEDMNTQALLNVPAQPIRMGCVSNTMAPKTCCDVLNQPKVHNAATVSFPSIQNANRNNFTQVVATPRKGGNKVAGNSFIQYIDIECTKQELEDALDEQYSDSSDWKIDEKQTKQGRTLLMYTDMIARGKNGVETNILAEFDRVNNKVHFTSFKMSSRNFYSTVSEDMQDVLCQLAYSHKGSYVGSYDGGAHFIINGQHKSFKEALVEEHAKIPYTQDCAVLEEDDSSSAIGSVGFTIKKPIKQFVQENPDVQAATKGLPFQEAMNKLGQIVLQKRATGELEGDEFIDYFRQIGIVGVTDPSLQKIYTLIKP